MKKAELVTLAAFFLSSPVFSDISPAEDINQLFFKQCMNQSGHVFESTKYPDGKIKTRVCLVDAQPDGPFAALDESGKIISQGQCHGGVPVSASGAWGAYLCQYTSTISESRFKLVQFRLSQVSAFQSSSGGQAFSGAMTWAPRFQLAKNRDLVFEFGLSAFPERSPQTESFLVISYSLHFARSFYSSPFILEAGPGLQTWVTSGTFFDLGARVGTRLGGFLGLPIDQLLLGYDYVFFSGDPSNQITLTAQLSF